ncbi:MAG: Mannosyl oligosaccharide glucosidase, partial [Phycisphaerales bacterium]|nr:Mannosyl oligosaccharide glucosidase [Phycisphaerales bacterium]
MAERTEKKPIDIETERLKEDAARAANWKRWGPYLSDRQWGTVREDYSPDGSAWTYFPHAHARSRSYRWGEDGLLGITDRECRLCFAPALWNGKDPILKERLFGLTNPQGNHGEDAKELWWHLDATPTGSYLKALYKYPQAEFPYDQLVAENAKRTRADREYEIQDTGVFDGGRYFDVYAEYAKAAPDDVLIRITVENRGPDAADIHVLPTLWYRNAWSWGCTHEGCYLKPLMRPVARHGVLADHMTLGRFRLEADPANDVDNHVAKRSAGPPRWLYTDNETNYQRVNGLPNNTRFVKDGFHDYVVNGVETAVDPSGRGTKAAPHYHYTLAPGERRVIQLRLFAEVGTPAEALGTDLFGLGFDQVFTARQVEADIFYAARIPDRLTVHEKLVSRRAYAGLLWSKQFYHYVVRDWIDGDPYMPVPPEQRKTGRNHDWPHLFNRDVVSMPDKWEYPWYASWDLAFHMIPMATVDPWFAKEQLILMLREWYMHPNGQMPAYEWSLGDVNPPVHAWACWRVYKISGRGPGGRDRLFLRRVFQKLLINFTWWVNRKDVSGKHVFAGGFLGMDNVGLFDRSAPLPDGTYLNQADGTAWMAFYCGVMLDMALELARTDPAYEDVASKFFEHFIAITDAMNAVGGTGLWDDADGFYYDVLSVDGEHRRLRGRTMVGIIPLLACQVIDDERLVTLAGFGKRTRWFMEHRKDLAQYITYMEPSARGASPGTGADRQRYLLAVPSREKLVRALRYVLDEQEFLSPHGIRSMSRHHLANPVRAVVHGQELSATYAAGESDSDLFGGNSNWRGPVWFPVNFLLVEALQRYHHYYGDTLKVECPTGSGRMMNLEEVARELGRRLTSLFVPDADGCRPCNGGCPRLDGADDPGLAAMVTFYEYFDGDTGRGLGASHQTGWTSLVARLLEDVGKRDRDPVLKPAGGGGARPAGVVSGTAATAAGRGTA